MAELTKKIEILNSHFDINRKKKEDIIVLNTTESSIMRKLTDILEILVIKVNNMGVLRNNVIDIIKLLNKLVNYSLRKM